MKCYDIKSEENLLPDITDTEIFKDYENNQSDYMRCIYFLYIALSKRENYYQLYSPTAFGNTEYARLDGFVCGILQATGWEEIQDESYIIIKRNNRKILILQKLSKPQSYYEDKKEIAKILNEIM
ncbi:MULTISPECIES: hypothetical protein [Bacillota]|jgi:hypothetical protein|uniref:Uncharacterized protein n=1 Tax=Roseburia intestinalis TaxID=166486 RepID=A0A413YWW5_9FIRM|nr:hypothetical protein [Roseburia intestinalis]RHC13527.1 hypothetical protein DW856_17185 [Roseburia intestinalis]